MTQGPDFYKLRDEVLALNVNDRENLRALLDRADQRAAILPSREEADLWQTITKLTPLSHFRSLTEFVRDKRNGVPLAEFKDAVRVVYDLLSEAQPVRHQVQDHAALLELVLECLVKDMRNRHVEINQKMILVALPRLRTAVEYCYPGYIDAGMLHRLIRVAVPA